MYIISTAKGKGGRCGIQCGISYGSVEMRGDGRLVDEGDTVGEVKGWSMPIIAVNLLNCYMNLIA